MENSALAIPNSNNYSAAEKQEGYKMKTTKGGVIFATNLDAHKSHVGSFMDTSPLLGKMVKKRMIKKKKKKEEEKSGQKQNRFFSGEQEERNFYRQSRV